MPRPATGQVLAHERQRGRVYQLRFRAGGKRRCVTLGTAEEGWTQEKAERELADTLALVRKGVWSPPAPPPPVEEPPAEVTFHEFASEWMERMRHRGLEERTLGDYEWSLSIHLLPFFATHTLAQITAREVDAYTAAKVRERRELDARRAEGEKVVGGLSQNTINKTLVRLAQILDEAVEYGLLNANPARGKRRRLKGTRPRRPFVEPQHLPALLDAAESYLAGRGRPLLATLAGAGLRIGEALDLRWGDVNLARGTLTVRTSKTDAGVRVVDMTPALREELTVWRATSKHAAEGDLVFGTRRGEPDNRQNVRTRLLLPAVARANAKLAKAGIEGIANVGLHGLRRTFASLRVAAGDDPVYVAHQLGHEDPRFTLKVYAQAIQRRERLTPKEREAFDTACEWARRTPIESPEEGAEWALLGATPAKGAPAPSAHTGSEHKKGPALQGL